MRKRPELKSLYKEKQKMDEQAFSFLCDLYQDAGVQGIQEAFQTCEPDTQKVFEACLKEPSFFEKEKWLEWISICLREKELWPLLSFEELKELSTQIHFFHAILLVFFWKSLVANKRSAIFFNNEVSRGDASLFHGLYSPHEIDSEGIVGRALSRDALNQPEKAFLNKLMDLVIHSDHQGAGVDIKKQNIQRLEIAWLFLSQTDLKDGFLEKCHQSAYSSYLESSSISQNLQASTNSLLPSVVPSESHSFSFLRRESNNQEILHDPARPHFVDQKEPGCCMVFWGTLFYCFSSPQDQADYSLKKRQSSVISTQPVEAVLSHTAI